MSFFRELCYNVVYQANANQKIRQYFYCWILKEDIDEKEKKQ